MPGSRRHGWGTDEQPDRADRKCGKKCREAFNSDIPPVSAEKWKGLAYVGDLH